MNRALLNPFEALKLPDNLELYLDNEAHKATCMAFNRRGNVLAVGCASGHIALWDFDTRASEKAPAAFVGGDAAAHAAHAAPPGHHVTSVAFPAPRTGHFLLASYAANRPPDAAAAAPASAAAAARHAAITREHGTGLVRLCHTLSGDVITEIAFDVPVPHVVPHPHRDNVLVVLPANMYPLLLTIAPGRYTLPKAVYDAPLGPDHVASVYPDAHPAGAARGPDRPDRPGAPASQSFVTVAVLHQPPGAGAHASQSAPAPASATIRRGARAVLDPYPVTFSACGRMLMRGSPSGVIHVFEFGPASPASPKRLRSFASARLANAFKVHGGAGIRSITLMRNKLLVNSFDRSLRLFDVDALMPPEDWDGENGHHSPPVRTTFTEAVNRSQAKCACFSRDGDFVLAGMLGATAHRIVVWRTSDGHPETVLEGPSEGITDLLWHPVQPVIASIGSQFGGVYVWAKNFTENWSAFAPEFTELEANEEYEETEGEFDAKHPQNDEHMRAEREIEEEKIIVDVDGSFGFSSDEEAEKDDSDNPLPTSPAKRSRFFYLPAIPVPDSNFPYPTSVDGKSARELAKASNGCKAGSKTGASEAGTGGQGSKKDQAAANSGRTKAGGTVGQRSGEGKKSKKRKPPSGDHTHGGDSKKRSKGGQKSNHERLENGHGANGKKDSAKGAAVAQSPTETAKPKARLNENSRTIDKAGDDAGHVEKSLVGRAAQQANLEHLVELEGHSAGQSPGIVTDNASPDVEATTGYAPG